MLKNDARSLVYIYIMICTGVPPRGQELCESRGGRPGPVRPNEPYGFCGRKATLNRASALVTVCP